MNYILFYPDEMRAESLGCYGHPLVQTPHIDRIAAEGTLFSKNYTPHPVCAASRCSLITGCYPHVHGHRSLWYLVDETEHNFIQEMRESGYTTGLFGRNHMFTEKAMQNSFDIFAAPPPFGHTGKSADNPFHPYSMILPPVPDYKTDEVSDMVVIDQCINFIDHHQPDDAPFFLFLSLFNPHPPYGVPEQYYHRYDPEKLPPMRDLSWLEGKPALYRLIHQYRAEGVPEQQLYQKIQAIYLGMVTFVDDMLGRLITALEQNGLYDDTTIIICSDHGDFAGDAQLIEKWPSAMDDMLTRVPLIIRRPGAKQGQRVDTPVSSIDIFPTIFDDAKLAVQHDQFGISLLPQLNGSPGDAARSVYCEGGYDTREPHSFEGYPLRQNKGMLQYLPKRSQQQEVPESVCRTVMQRDNRYKLIIRTNGENELYDMDCDPLEYHNLYDAPACAKLQQALKDRLLTWSIGTADTVPREGHF